MVLVSWHEKCLIFNGLQSSNYEMIKLTMCFSIIYFSFFNILWLGFFFLCLCKYICKRWHWPTIGCHIAIWFLQIKDLKRCQQHQASTIVSAEFWVSIFGQKFQTEWCTKSINALISILLHQIYCINYLSYTNVSWKFMVLYIYSPYIVMIVK